MPRLVSAKAMISVDGVCHMTDVACELFKRDGLGGRDEGRGVSFTGLFVMIFGDNR